MKRRHRVLSRAEAEAALTAASAAIAPQDEKRGSNRRNTELFLLVLGAVPVLLLYALYVMNAGLEVSLSTLGVPIALCLAFLAAHISIRWLAPGADPAILPIVFVLSGVGITMLTRLNEAYAVNQVIWLFLSVAAMVGVLFVVAQPRQARRVQVHAGHRGRGASAAPHARGHREVRLQAVGWHRQLQLPAGRVRQDPHRPLPGLLPGGQQGGALRLHAPGGPLQGSAHPHAPAPAHHVGHQPAARRLREGPGQRPAVLCLLRHYAVCLHGSRQLRRGELPAAGRRRRLLLPLLRPRPDAHQHLA